jgi:hypothetical protein
MNDQEFKKHIELLLSMCTDYLMGGLTRQTFVSNLRMIIKNLEKK